jgi:hypothetical protein
MNPGITITILAFRYEHKRQKGFPLSHTYILTWLQQKGSFKQNIKNTSGKLTPSQTVLGLQEFKTANIFAGEIICHISA